MNFGDGRARIEPRSSRILSFTLRDGAARWWSGRSGRQQHHRGRTSTRSAGHWPRRTGAGRGVGRRPASPVPGAPEARSPAGGGRTRGSGTSSPPSRGDASRPAIRRSYHPLGPKRRRSGGCFSNVCQGFSSAPVCHRRGSGPDVREIKGASHYPLKGVSVLGLKNATESRTPSKPAGHRLAGAAADTVTAQYWPASPAWTGGRR